ncbi:MAG: phosphatidate cytidylyltransferase [Nitrospirota bacterium]
MHLRRLLVAAIILPLIYLFIMHMSAEYFLILLILVSLLAMSEFYSMYRVTGALRYSGLLGGVLVLGTSYISKEYTLDVLMLFVVALMSIRLMIKSGPSSSLRDISPAALGLLYIPCLFAFQTQIRKLGPEWIIYLYAVVWASDTMAYYIGKGMGKRRLYETVSPNKTVAGAVGSLIGGMTAALLLKTLMVQNLETSTALFIGIMIGAICVIGDLVESMFKRDAGVKDSSTLIPGHGGILDKIDGALFAGPFLFWTLKFTGIMK